VPFSRFWTVRSGDILQEYSHLQHHCLHQLLVC
jgi:hypothetical protein